MSYPSYIVVHDNWMLSWDTLNYGILFGTMLWSYKVEFELHWLFIPMTLENLQRAWTIIVDII